MVTFEPKDPDAITLIVTYRCNASCEMCCHGCRPNFGHTMTIEQMKRYVDICLETYSHSINLLALTGGECFLLGNDLDEIIKYGASKGLKISVLSNGYWGYNYSEARKRIQQLKEAGLTHIGFSAGDDHNHNLPFKGVRNAVVASARAGYQVDFRTEDKYSKRKVQKAIENDSVLMKLIKERKVIYHRYIWDDFNNEKIHFSLMATRHRYDDESYPCVHLCHQIEITPYGDVLACSGIGNTRIPQLRLGNIEKEPIRDIYERTFQDALKMWIHRSGPAKILNYIYDKSNITTKYRRTSCDCCKEIFSNPKIIPFLKENALDWMDQL